METLVGLAYEAADNPGVWPEFLQRLAALLNSPSAISVMQDKGSNPKWSTVTGSFGIAPTWHDWAYYATINPYAKHTYEKGVVRVSDHIVPAEELIKTEFYNDFVRPQGWFHSASIETGEDQESLQFLVLMRPKTGGIFTPAEVKLFQNIGNHVARSYRIWTRIRELEAKLDCFATRDLDHQKLVSLYDLNPSEVRLVAAIFKGETVEGYAERIHISVNTARWQVRQIYAKTGAKRQTDLIKILANILAH